LGISFRNSKGVSPGFGCRKHKITAISNT